MNQQGVCNFCGAIGPLHCGFDDGKHYCDEECYKMGIDTRGTVDGREESNAELIALLEEASRLLLGLRDGPFNIFGASLGNLLDKINQTIKENKR